MTDSLTRPPTPAYESAPSAGGAAPSRADAGPRGDVGPRADVAGERRVITVLFCDVVGSTSLASRFDPEEWAEVMNEAFRYMIAPIEEYGGMVARLMGDAVLAFFGAPQAHEDDPQRAVLAGLGIVNGIRPFIRQFEQEYGWEFNVRVGINTGPVVVGEVGAGQAGEYTAMGDAINLAARMEQTAAPGTVQIAEDTYRLVAPLFDVWDLGGIEVKGKDTPVQAYRVLGLEPQPGRLRGLEGVRSPLVGREREIGRLRDILEGLRNGRSRICYLIGEAGLGKSRLVAELRREWRDGLAAAYGDVDPLWRGWTEFVAVSYGAGRPYDMLKRQIRTYCGIRETDPPAVIHERLNTLISLYPTALHERIRRLFGFLLGGDPGSEPAEGEAFQRELRAVIEQMARVQVSQGPVVYVIDDVHWADVASLETVRALLPLTHRPGGGHAVLFLFAMRPDWNTPGWQLYLEAQMEYPEYAASIYLEPLTAADSRTLVRELLENADAPERVYDLIERKAEGNPFFVEETVRTLLDSGALRRENGGFRWDASTDLDRIADLIGLPGNVQALLTARIDRLEPPARRTMQLASVIGRSFPLRVLERIADRPAETLEEHLKRLAQADLVRPSLSGAEAEYAFRHALTRDAAYETILIRRRRQYHRRVAEAIESLYADRLPDEAPRLAYHCGEARDWARAIHYYALAGEAAARLYANTEAAEHYRRALAIAQANPAAVDESTLAALMRRLGRVYEVAGRFDDALSLYDTLEKLGESGGNPTLQLEGLIPQATIYLTPTPFQDAARGCSLAERILTLAGQTGRRDAEAYGHWALLLLYTNSEPDPVRAVAEGEQALSLAREYGLTELEAYVLNDIGRPYAAAGRVDDAFRAFEAAYQRWRDLGNEPMMADILAIWSTGLTLRGNLAAAEQTAREGLQIGQRIGNFWAQAFNSYALAWALYAMGRTDQAVPLFRATFDLALRAGFISLAAAVPVVLRWLGNDPGLPSEEYEQPAAIMAEVKALQPSSAEEGLWQALDRHFAGDAAGAFASVEGIILPDVGRGGPESVMMTIIVATLALRAGHAAEALRVIDGVLAEIETQGFTIFREELQQLRAEVLRQLGLPTAI